MSKNKVGRPPKYKTKEEIQEKIDVYFKECEGKPLLDKEGDPLLDKNGVPIMYGVRPLTITGLALALGFSSRQSLLDYQAKEEFAETIRRAKTIVERYAEEKLFDKAGASGAKFSLTNNFEGWREKQQIETEVNSAVNIKIELVDE